jgi:hypothetical protein
MLVTTPKEAALDPAVRDLVSWCFFVFVSSPSLTGVSPVRVAAKRHFSPSGSVEWQRLAGHHSLRATPP